MVDTQAETQTPVSVDLRALYKARVDVVGLYPHQKEAVNKLANGKILCGGVGSGKSLTAAAYYILHEAPKDVYVITTAKKRDSLDWSREFAKFGVGRDAEATIAGRLVVDSWHNVHKYTRVYGCFFIFDEQRIVGSGRWVKSFLKLAKRNHWILLSATPGDNWLDYVPVFVANRFFANRSEFKREHVVYVPWSKFPKIIGYNNEGKLNRLRRSLLVEMPFQRHTKRHCMDLPVEYDKEKVRRVLKDRWHVYEERPIRNVAELFLVMRRVVNSDSTRLDAVTSLLNSHPRLIVFYNFDFELEELRSLSTLNNSKESALANGETEENRWQTQKPVDITSSTQSFSKDQEPQSSALLVKPMSRTRESSRDDTIPTTNTSVLGSKMKTGDLVVAEWNGHRHDPVPDTEHWLYLVQYSAGAEGWNCIDTDAMCFYSLPYSYKLFHQAHGRIDRLNTKFEDLYYYVLLSTSPIDKMVRAALREKRTFNETALSLYRMESDI